MLLVLLAAHGPVALHPQLHIHCLGSRLVQAELAVPADDTPLVSVFRKPPDYCSRKLQRTGMLLVLLATHGPVALHPPASRPKSWDLIDSG